MTQLSGVAETAAPAQLTVYQKLWNKELPRYPIYCNDELGLMATLDIFPVTPGHVLVIPAEPAKRWTDLEPERQQQVSFLSRLVAKRQIAVLGAKSISNNYFGDQVPHAHNHNIPDYGQRGEVIGRLQPDSGRMSKPADAEELRDMQWTLLFPAALRDYADLELSLMGEKNPFKYFVRSLLHARRLHQGRKAFA